MTTTEDTNRETSWLNRRRVLKAGAIGFASAATFGGEVAADEESDWENLPLEDQLERVLEATEEFEDDLEAADEAGYVSLSPLICGMGFHFINESLIPGLDPENPAALVYTLQGSDLKLGSVEYLVPKAGPYSDDPPDLFNDEGEDLETSEEDGWVVLGEGGSELWTLHVWVYEDNPEGVFHPVNPRFFDMPGCLGEH